MPQIEVLPLHASHTRSQPGWAYVPDISSPNQPPTAHQPGNRKRAARLSAHTTYSAGGAHSISAKQQKAIEQRLKDLDKENYRDVHVPIPKRDRGADGKEKQNVKKVTSNVRRILGYSRAFAHYLADEEAAIAAGGGGFAGTWGQGASAVVSGGGGGLGVASAAGAGAGAGMGAGRRGEREDKRKSLGMTATTEAKGVGRGRGRGKRQSTAKEDEVKKETEAETLDVEMADTDAAGTDGHTAEQQMAAPADPSSEQKTPSQPTSSQPPPPRYDPALDADPLLRTLNLPPKPSDRVIAALLAEPPLSYTAARAKPLDDDKRLPRRHFCSVCGYWGKVRCRRCGERTCGLMECWKGHEVGGCVPY